MKCPICKTEMNYFYFFMPIECYSYICPNCDYTQADLAKKEIPRFNTKRKRRAYAKTPKKVGP